MQEEQIAHHDSIDGLELATDLMDVLRQLGCWSKVLTQDMLEYTRALERKQSVRIHEYLPILIRSAVWKWEFPCRTIQVRPV